MAIMDAVLRNDPKAKRLAREALEERTDLQVSGLGLRRCRSFRRLEDASVLAGARGIAPLQFEK